MKGDDNVKSLGLFIKLQACIKSTVAQHLLMKDSAQVRVDTCNSIRSQISDVAGDMAQQKRSKPFFIIILGKTRLTGEQRMNE